MQINIMFLTAMMLGSACLYWSPNSLAQETTEQTDQAEAAQISDAKMEAAQRYMEAVEYEKQVKATMLTSSTQFLQLSLALAEEKYDAPLPDDLEDYMGEVMAMIIDEVGDDFAIATRQRAASLFANTFTLTELNRLTEIQSDPVMKKFVQLSPIITPELINIGITEMQSFQPLIESRTLEAIQKYFDDNNTETS